MADISSEFEQLYRTNYRMLRNAAENIIGDKDASHDVVQEVFIKLFNKNVSLTGIANHKAYLFRSVVNASITYLSQSKKAIGFAELRVVASAKTDEEVLLKELESKIQLALNKLPPKCKAVFVLSRFEELKNKEIAKTLGLSEKTVENQMGIALKKIRAELKSYLAKDITVLALCGGLSFLIHFVSL